MCEDCKVRFEKNALRLLDCKEERCAHYKDNAPKPREYLCENCKNHFNRLKELIEIRKKHESNILIAFLERDLKIKDLLTEDQWKIFKKKFPKNINFCEQKNKCPKDKNRHNEKKDSKNYSQRKFRDK